jgi:hypothetical protein
MVLPRRAGQFLAVVTAEEEAELAQIRAQLVCPRNPQATR